MHSSTEEKCPQVPPEQIISCNNSLNPYIFVFFFVSYLSALYFICLDIPCISSDNVQESHHITSVYNFDSKGFKICSHNVNRLENKLEEIRHNLLQSANAPDIIGCCETFFNDIIPDTSIQVPGYTTVRKDRYSNMGGGWVIYINESISFERKEQFEISGIETVWLEIKPDYKKPFIIGFVYRNPRCTNDWIDLFEEELQVALNYSNDIIIAGDFNIDLLPPSKPPQKWQHVLETYSLHQLINEPTRVTKDSKTLIDHIYVTNLSQVYETHVVKYSISDHYPVCITRHLKPNLQKKHSHNTITYRNCKTLNEEAFLQDLFNAPFYSVEFENDPDLCLQRWYDIFNSILDKHAPIITKRVKNDHQPEWYKHEITESRNMRDKCNRLGLWDEYKFWRNKTKTVTEDAKCKYYTDLVKDSKDSKTLWKCINTLTPPLNTYPSRLKTDNEKFSTDPTLIANIFNDFFTSCVKDLRKGTDEHTTHFQKLKSYVNGKVAQEHNFKVQPIDMNKLYEDLCNLDETKSTGLDNIGPRILKLSAPAIVTSLTYIFNRIIDSGKFPMLFKNAKVTPIYKKGDRTEATNYRPISVLSTLSKLIEQHISKQLYGYLTDFNLLHTSQSGFRPHHSCQTALINITDKWLKEINDGNINGVVFLDLKKAFDVVDHDILYQKLEIYRFDECALALFKSYLNKRTQQVKIGNVMSESTSVDYGVPQGSILGPLLFILYINDLPLHVEHCEMDIYADDSTFHLSGKAVPDIQDKIQTDLDLIDKWCSENKMYINIEKTKCMTVGTRQKLSCQDDHLKLHIKNEALQTSKCEKVLGVEVDPTLTWSAQVDQICSAVSSRIYLLSKIKQYLNLEARKLFCNGYILPLIDYCCTIWGNCSEDNLNRVLKLQKRAARLVFDAGPLSSSEPLFKELKWMPVKTRINYHKLLLIYKSLHHQAPEYLSGNLTYVGENNPYCLRNAVKGNLYPNKPKTELYKKSFQYSASVLWNDLPNDIRQCSNLHIFKKRLKNYLLLKSP